MKQQVKISQVIPNKDNPRVIKDAKFKELVKSIKGFPKMFEKRPIVVDENMIVLGGNMRLKAAQAAGLKEVWIDDTEDWTSEEKREFIIKDNVPYGEWEWDMLANEWDSVLLNEYGLDVWENQDDKEDENVYTQKIETPKYESTGEKPEEHELCNEEKARELIKKISISNATAEEKNFLIKAAYRHTVFNYKNIAEFYIQSNKEVQELMEDSALVIIDFKKAIEGGYISLNEKITNQYLEEYGE